MAASRLGKSKPCLLLPLLSLLGCTLAVQLHQQMPTEVPPSSVSNLLVQSAMDSLNEGQAFKSGVLAKARKVVVMKPPYVLYKLTLNLIPACRDPEESCPHQACTLDVRQHEGGVIDVLKNSIQCVHIEPETKQSTEKEIIENIEKQIINQGTSLDQEVQTSAEHNDRPFVAVRASHSDYCPGCPYELNPSLPGLHSFTYLTEKSMDEVTRGDFKHKVISILKVSRSVPPTIRIIQYELMMEIGETTCLKTTNIKVSNCPIQPNLPINICAVYFEEYPWQEETRRLTRNNCTDVLNTDNEVSGNYDPYSYRFEPAAPNREEDVSSKTEFYDQIAQEAQEVSRLNPEIGTEKELTPTKITIEKNIESEGAPTFHEKMKQFDEFLEDFDLPIKLETTTPKYLGVPVTEKLFIKEKVEEKVIEKQSSIKPSIKPTEEIASTKLTEDPKNTKLIEEPTPTSTKLAEESRSTILTEEPTLTSTKFAEEPSSTKLTEEPTPTSTKFIEEPKSTKLSQEPISTQIPEELTSISIKLTEGQTSTKLTEKPTPNTKFTEEATSTKLTEEPTPTSTKLAEEPIPTNMKLVEELIKINQENTKTKDLVLNPTVESVRSKRSTKPLENNKSMLRKLAIIAVEMLDNLDEDNKKKHVIDVIDSQRERKEHGIVYYITVEVAPTDCSEKDKNTECLDEVIPGPTQICYMDVAINEKKPLESPKLLQYKCKNKQKSELRFKRQMLGAPTSHSPDDPEVQKFVKLGLKKYSDGYQGTYEPIISNVKEVSVQVVSGLLYKIKTDIGVSTCKKGISENCLLNSEEGVKECIIEAWSQRWMDDGNPKITVKCNEDKRKKRSLKGQNYTQKMLKQSRELKEEKLFNEFIIKYERNYESDEEKERRFKIFRDNLDMIEELQRNEQGTGRYGVTRFADLTKAEFKSNYLGLKPSLKSENDIPMPMAEIPDIPLPKEFDWRTKNVVTDVKDQGSCGSCWAFSVTGNVEGQYAIKHGKLLSLSEQELVDCDKLDDGCNGGLPDNAYRAIEEIGGLELESDYPYDAEDETCHFNKNKVKVNVVSGLNITSNETQMAQWLVKNGPMSIGINANAMQFYIGGVSHPFHFLCSPDDLDHGVLIVGYGIKTYPIFKKKMPYWIIKNSWGPRWGEQGYYRIYRGDGTCGVNKMVTSAVIA